MSSNEILFNSAALHSLKRAQLVKICKRHGLKASGKNAELIQRLEEYAKNLSDDSAIPGAFDVPTSDAPGDDDDEENEDEDDNASTTTKTPSRNLGTVSTRPSEPWSVLDEDDEPKGLFPTVNSQQTGKATIAITTTGLAEFGTETQPEAKSSSVGSSLRAFATTLKRVATIGSSSSLKSKSSSQDVQNPEPTPTSAPTRSSPSPSPEPPVPQPTTYCPDPSLASSTIRLIPTSSSTNLLSKAGESSSSDSGTKNDTSDSNEFMVPTKFDDDSSCDEDFGTEDPSQKRKSSLYPELPEFARITAAASAANLLPGGFPSVDFSNFSFAAAPTSPTTDDQPAPTTGAPVPPGVAKTTMAASIMEEMNRRMGIDPNSSAAIGFGIFEKKPSLPSTTIAPPKGGDRFNKAHDGLFDKMDSIANHYAARRNPSKARKPVSRNSTTSKPRSSLSATPSAAKRRSKANEAGKRASRSSLVAASEKRLFSPPPAGSSAPQDDVPMEADEADETDESFAHVGFVTGGDGKKRVTICSPEDDEEDDKDQAMPGGFFDGPSTSKPATPRPSKQVKVVNATPAEKRKLNQAKAKRRSSAARASMGRASIVGAAAVKQVAPQPAKTGGKFGFLKSGAKLVKSLWGGSKATTAAKPAPVAPAATKVKSRAWGYGGGAATDKGKAKATVGTTSSTAAGANPSTAAVQKLTSPALAVPTTAPANPAAPKTTAATGSRTSNPGLAPRPDGVLPKRRIVSGGSSVGARKSSSVSTTGIGFRSITTARPPVPPPMGVSPIGASRTRPSSLATGKAAASTSNPARNSSAAPAGKKSVVPPSKSAAGSNFGFDLDRARSPPGPGVKKPSTLTMPTAASLAKMQSNAKRPANENQSVKSPSAPSFHNFGFKGSPARSSNVATAAAGATSPKVAMRSGIPSPFKMPSTLGAITNTVDKTDGDEDQAMADDQDDDFNVPPSKSAANTINTISSSVSGASVRSSRSLGKRPKIERAKVMARLEEKRAAAAAAATATTSSGAAGSRSSVIGLPASIRDPTLAQANSRRSHGTAALAGTPTRRRKDIELAVQLSAKKASIRKSEVAAKARMSQTSDVSMSSIYGGIEM